MIAWIVNDPAAEQVETLLDRAETGQIELMMSMINLGEVFHLLARRHGTEEAEQFLSDFHGMPIRTVIPTAHSIIEAARLKGRYAISYSDAFAVEAARHHGASLVTGNSELRALSKAKVVEIDWIGRGA